MVREWLMANWWFHGYVVVNKMKFGWLMINQWSVDGWLVFQTGSSISRMVFLHAKNMVNHDS